MRLGRASPPLQHLRRVRAVSFDATGTLFKLNKSVGQTYVSGRFDFCFRIFIHLYWTIRHKLQIVMDIEANGFHLHVRCSSWELAWFASSTRWNLSDFIQTTRCSSDPESNVPRLVEIVRMKNANVSLQWLCSIVLFEALLKRLQKDKVKKMSFLGLQQSLKRCLRQYGRPLMSLINMLYIQKQQQCWRYWRFYF